MSGSIIGTISTLVGLLQIKPIRNKIHITETYKPGAFDQFPDANHDDHDRDLDVVRDEVDGLEVRAKTGPALDEHQDCVEAHGNDGADWVCPVLEGK